MSGKRSSRIRTSADDTTTSRSTRTGIDLDRDMTDLYQSRHCANSPEPRKVLRLGLVLARKLFGRSHDERPHSPDRTDRIFYVHATNEQQDMQRRTAEGDPRRPVKLDISKPLTSPPAPDSKLMDRNRERQDAYNRSLTSKSRPLDASGIKRWSLRSWRTQSTRAPSPEQSSMGSIDIGEAISSGPTATERRNGGRDHKRSESEPKPETSSLRSGSIDRFSKRLPIPFERSVMSLRIHKKSSYDNMSAASAQSICIIEDPLEPVPRSSRNRGMSFSDQRWAPIVSPTVLGTIAEDQRPLSPVHPGHRHAASSFSITRQHGPPPFQVPRKSASTGMLRPQVASNNHLAVPLRPGVPGVPATTDQRHIHPALRSLPTPSPTTSIFPSTGIPSELVLRPIPRVRIIPPSTIIDPDEFSAAKAERALLASRPPMLPEQLILLNNINATRATVCNGPVDLHPLLSNRAQDYVSLQLPPLPPPKPIHPGHKRQMSMAAHQNRSRGTKIEPVEFHSPSGASAIRLISPPGLGALACGELWASGKYKRHKTVKTGHVPADHRFTLLPGFEMSDRESVIPVVSSGHTSATWCSCAEYDSWKAVTDARWKSVGIGRAEDGRWVVEFWEPMGSGSRSL